MAVTVEQIVFRLKGIELAQRLWRECKSGQYEGDELLQKRAFILRAERYLEKRYINTTLETPRGLRIHWYEAQRVYLVGEPFGNVLTWLDEGADLGAFLKRVAHDHEWLKDLSIRGYHEAVHEMPEPSGVEVAKHIVTPLQRKQAKRQKRELPKIPITLSDLNLFGDN